MDDALYFSEQHLATREMVSQFARDEVAPIAAKHDADATFPWNSIRKMGELGLLGVPWPEELGGAGLDLLSYMIVIHELAKVDASHGLTISAHTTLGTSPIVRFGTEEQKQKYVPFLATGRVLGGFGLTEPEAGSDAGGTRSTAVRHGNCYVLNGVKRFITHGGVGEIFVVTAVTREAPRASARSSSPRKRTIPKRPRASAWATSLHCRSCPVFAPARRRTSSAGAPPIRAS
jgi:butyryl-CoA dehydrogenase